MAPAATDASEESAERDTKERLLNVAIELLDEFGYERVRLKDVAERSGLSTGAVYWFYRDRGALLDAALVERYARRVAAFSDRTTNSLDGYGETVLQHFAVRPSGAIARERSLVLAAASRDAGLAARVRELHEDLIESLAAQFQVVRPDFQSAQDIDPRAIAAALFALFVGFEVLDVNPEYGLGSETMLSLFSLATSAILARSPTAG